MTDVRIGEISSSSLMSPIAALPNLPTKFNFNRPIIPIVNTNFSFNNGGVAPINMNFKFAKFQLNLSGVSGSGSSASYANFSSSSRVYNPNALPELRNSALLSNMSESQKTQILDIVDRACKQYGVDPKFVMAIMKQETGKLKNPWNPNAVSPCGAKGLMQLMDGTARQYGVTNSYDMEQNIFAGVHFLKDLLDKYNGNISLAAAAYNAGEGAVSRFNGVPPYAETQKYVRDVQNHYQQLA